MAELLLDVIELNDISQTTIIIDARNKANQDSFFDIIEILEPLINEASGLIQIFISSRPKDYINSSLDNWPVIEVDLDFARKDIETYIESQVDKGYSIIKE
jgi:hypothetical protein